MINDSFPYLYLGKLILDPTVASYLTVLVKGGANRAVKVKEVSRLTGVSVRTLHYYDQIGLLVPDKIPGSGYRVYTQDHLEMLQQILFFRELGFPLQKIKEIIHDPSFDQVAALKLHRKLLMEKRRRLDRMIAVIDKTILNLKGEIDMTIEERFAGLDFGRNPHEQEARQRWGDEAVDQANERLAELSQEEKRNLSERWDAVYKRLASLRNGPPDTQEAQEAIAEWYLLLNSFGHYTPEMFRALGQMYVDDERFTQNIDRYGEGLARFMRDAMSVFADQHKEPS